MLPDIALSEIFVWLVQEEVVKSSSITITTIMLQHELQVTMDFSLRDVMS